MPEGYTPTRSGRQGHVQIDRRWLADKRLSDSALRLMCWLDSHTDDYLRDISAARTAKEIGWSRDRVSRTLKSLEELGLISTTQAPLSHSPSRTRTVITLHMSEWSDRTPHRDAPMPHGEADPMPHGKAGGMPHGEAPSHEQVQVVGEHSQEPPNPPEGGGSLVIAGVTFDAWYATFPKKQGREIAERKWRKLSGDERRECIDRQAVWNEHWSRHPEGAKFCPMASTWINQKRWRDEIPDIARPAVRESPSTAALRAAMQNRMNQ